MKKKKKEKTCAPSGGAPSPSDGERRMCSREVEGVGGAPGEESVETEWLKKSTCAGSYLRLIDSCITQLKAQGRRMCSREADGGGCSG